MSEFSEKSNNLNYDDSNNLKFLQTIDYYVQNH